MVFLQKFDLEFLDLGQAFPLPHDQVIDLLVQMPNLEFRLRIDLIVVEGTQPVLRLLALLAHHDDWGLDGGQAG